MEKFDKLNDIKNTKFAQFNTKEEMVDTSFVILTSLCPIIICRRDVMVEINNLLRKYSNILIHSSSVIIKCRVLHFISYYFEAMVHFPENQEFSLKYLKFAIDMLNNQEDENEAVRYTAIGTIKNILKLKRSPKVKDMLPAIQDSLFESLVLSLEENDNDDLLRIFTSIIGSKSAPIIA